MSSLNAKGALWPGADRPMVLVLVRREPGKYGESVDAKTTEQAEN